MAKSGEDFGLENTEFDVVVIGTSMVQSLLAGTLAASGKKVLHLDSNSFYGGRYNTFTLGSLASFLSPPEPETEDDGDDAAQTPAPEATAESASGRRSSSASGEQQQQQEKPKKPKKKKVEKEESSNLRVRVKKVFPSGNREEAFGWASAAQFRSFNIDYTPKVLWCTGDLVDVLIATSVTRYLEFHAIQQSYLYLSSSNSSPSPSNLQLVPCSKGEIFKSKLLSLTEKRRLMKFIQLCSVDPVSNPEVIPYLEKPFSEFVRSQKLPPTLESFILYAIGLVNEPFESVSIDTIEGLQRLENYLGSLGRYGGSSPFLYPAYGTSELAQAFCRLCAVHGGTYMLRLATKELLFEEGEDGKKKIVGLVSDEGQTFKSSWFVMDKEEALGSLAKSGVTAAAEASKDELLELGTARAVIITNSKLVPHKASGGTEEEQQAINNVFFVIPPRSQGIDNPHAIHALQLSWGLSVAPRNHYLIHLSTQSSEGAEDALQRAIDVLFRPKTPSPAPATPSEGSEGTEASTSSSSTETTESSEKAEDDLRPEALWYAIFTQWIQTAAPLPAKVEESLPSNLLYFSDRSSLISGFESELEYVMRLYNKIVGPEGEPFPPKIDPDEGVYAGGGDEDEEPKPSTLVQPTASSEPAPNASSAMTEEAEEGSQAEQQPAEQEGPVASSSSGSTSETPEASTPTSS